MTADAVIPNNAEHPGSLIMAVGDSQMMLFTLVLWQARDETTPLITKVEEGRRCHPRQILTHVKGESDLLVCTFMYICIIPILESLAQ